MEFHSFDSWSKDNSVDKLVFNNDRMVKSPSGVYGLIGIPKLFFENGTPILPNTTPYQTTTKGLYYPETMKFGVPAMVVYKTVLFQKSSNAPIVCLYEPNNPFIEAYRTAKNTNTSIATFFEYLLEQCESEFQKLHRITHEIKRLTTYIDFFVAYQLIEYTDILISHTLNYTMFLQDLHTFAIHANINTQSFDKTYATFRDSVKLLNDILEQTRHGAMQRIAYLDSGTARILTIVATIFLPLAFLVALFSMPLQGAPLRRKKNAYWVFVYIILVIFVALVALFYRDFIALFKGSA
jgi:hypothetical protein